MIEKRLQFLLDMDGVLVDFISGALAALNRDFKREVTIEEYAMKFGKWETYDYYGITPEQFWKSIDATPSFWAYLKPYPWYKDLYDELSGIGNVTIVTSPSQSNQCIIEKYYWLKRHLNIDKEGVVMCSRKYLMAAPGNILIDDYFKNVESFREAGGNAILIPSNWNTVDLTYEEILHKILSEFKVLYLWKA